MELNLKGKVAVITGGSKGIGRSTAFALAEQGAVVVTGSRTVPAELRDADGIDAVAVDLSTVDGPAELVSRVVDTHGGIDLLINNVGMSEPGPSASGFTDDQWQRIFDITLFATVRTMRAAAPVLRDDGSVLNVSSLNSRLPAGMLAPYSAAKAALTNFGKALAEEFAPRGIRVNTVSPGPVRTPMWTDPGAFAEIMAPHMDTTPDELMDGVLAESMGMLTGRVAEPEEIADLVLFLLSDRAASITGANYVIDGGMHKSVS